MYNNKKINYSSATISPKTAQCVVKICVLVSSFGRGNQSQEVGKNDVLPLQSWKEACREISVSGAQASKKKEFSFAVRSRFPATQCWEMCSQHVCVGTGARGISILAESQFDKETSALLKQAHKRQPCDAG